MTQSPSAPRAMECLEARISLGVYVLGAIDPAERAQVDAHLMTCRDCRDELAGLAGLPALLSRVSMEEAIALADTEQFLRRARLATPSTNLKLHRPHQRVPKKIRTAPGFQRQSIDTSFGGRQFHPRRMRLPTRTIPHATSGSVHRPR